MLQEFILNGRIIFQYFNIHEFREPEITSKLSNFHRKLNFLNPKNIFTH